MPYDALIILLFHAVLAPATGIHALLSKRDPRAAFGWIAVCLLAPLAGPVIYLFFGVNRARDRAQRLTRSLWGVGYERGLAEPVQPLPEFIRPEYRELARVGQALSRHPLVEGNSVEPLFNGEQAYPAMLDAIGRSRRHVYLTTYILGSDGTGRCFREALADAVARGVDVRVLIDGFGEWYSFPRAGRALRRAGIRVARFLPPRLLPPSLSINMRNHHKILVVDGSIAFTGGMNIGDRHLVEEVGNRRPTADVHFRIDGPAAAQLCSEFLRTWKFASGEGGEAAQAQGKRGGGLACRTVTDGPDEDLDRLTMLLTAAIAGAKQSIDIMTPYFLPPREIVGALQAAAIRGIALRIVLPEKNNLPYVHWATRNMLWEVLFRGAEVFYQPPPFNHAKLFVVDGYYTLIGSTNWDSRSLRLNFELQVEVYGKGFARPLVDYVDRAIQEGRPVTLDEVDGRGTLTRLRDSFCWLFSPYL